MSKGVILAGGRGTRLYPMTVATSKQLLPVYDKPLVYYPLSTLLEAGIGDILVITSPQSLASMRLLLGDGEAWGARISYAIQEEPRGIAQALLIAEKCGFWEAANEPVTLILGDNIFDWPELAQRLKIAYRETETGKASLFTARVAVPERYGVLSWTQVKVWIEEKPKKAKSPYAVTGLYVYPAGAHEVAASLKPSFRNELEITAVNNHYVQGGRAWLVPLDASAAWFDAGTPDAMLAASQYVAAVQQRQGRLVGSPEVAAVVGGLLPEEGYDSPAQRVVKLQGAHYFKRVNQDLAARQLAMHKPSLGR